MKTGLPDHLYNCPHFFTAKGRPRCLAPELDRATDCSTPKNVRNCSRLQVPVTGHAAAREFIEKRLESFYKGTRSYEKRELALEFAEVMYSILRSRGTDLVDEYAGDTSWKVTLKSGEEMTIVSDAVARLGNVKAALEIKYMERGMIFTPDIKTVAYDYLFFKKNYPESHFCVISGGRLTHDPAVERILRYYTDATWDVNIWQEDFDERIDKLVRELQELGEREPVVIKDNPAGWKPVETAVERKTVSAGSGGSPTSPYSRGRKLETRVRDYLVSQGEQCSRKRPGFETAGLGTGDITVPIVVDLCKPDCIHPETLIECKDVENLGRGAKTVVFDAWHLKKQFPGIRYEAWLGPSVKKVPVKYLKGEVDKIVKLDEKRIGVE